jgi:DNA-binding MarR family transcriptional regulator
MITSVYDEALRPFGITAGQMNILVAVSAFGPTQPKDVCRVLKLDPSTLSRNVERMKKREWLQARPGDEDARIRVLRVTQEGLKLIEQAFPAWEQAQGKAAELLGREGLKGIMDLGDRLLGMKSAKS